MQTDTQNDWNLRATFTELLSLSFRYPEHELANALATGEFVAATDEVLAAMQITSIDTEPLAAYTTHDPEALLRTLRVEATHLFIGATDPIASPYEGVWAAIDDGVQPLLFVNPKSMQVERYMRSCGVGRPQGTNEPLDHIATELEFLSYLASIAAGIAEPPEGVSVDDFPGGSAAAAYEQFMHEHLDTWAARFVQRVVAESREPFYTVMAQVLAESL